MFSLLNRASNDTPQCRAERENVIDIAKKVTFSGAIPKNIPINTQNTFIRHLSDFNVGYGTYQTHKVDYLSDI